MMDTTNPESAGTETDTPLAAGSGAAERRRDELYQLVLDGFAELGVPLLRSVTRTLLICDRQLVGQRFCCEGGQAIWRAAQSVLEFYDAGGQLRKSVPVNHFCAVRDAA